VSVGLCLLIAGKLLASLPVSEFTLAWTHSVQKTRWEEHYRVEPSRLVLTQAAIEGSGAGMEPPAGAVERDGMWRWNPGTSLDRLRLTVSSFTADYEICVVRGCQALQALVGRQPDGTVVEALPCGNAAR
jgi:hypothetical protein